MRKTREERLKLKELIHLLEKDILLRLEVAGGIWLAKVELWKWVRTKVKRDHPNAKSVLIYQQREWESHPLQHYITLVELNMELPDVPNLSFEEWNEYLEWKATHHQGIKEWKRYGRSDKSKEVDPKDNQKKQEKARPSGARAYVPRGKTSGGSQVQSKVKQEENKGREKIDPRKA